MVTPPGSGEAGSPAAAADQRAATLVEAVRAGDTDAYATIYRLYVRLVETVVREHVTDPVETADAVQEVFTRALAGLDRLRDPGRLRPWLCSIARNVAVDASRRGRAELPLAELSLDEWEVGAATEPDPAALAEVMELAERLRNAVVSMLPRDAVALSLVGLGFGPAEVAIALGTTHGAAKVVVHRARRRLREALVQQVLVRRSGCDTLTAAVERGDFGDLPQHVSACEVCRGDAGAPGFKPEGLSPGV